MANSVLRGTSSATRTMDERQIAALRPATAAPRRQRKPRREPADRSLTFFCSNPQCDHATWAPTEQAKHMAREFWEVAQALVRLAPESTEALLLTGGVILRDLTDDECREAYNLYERYKRAGVDELPVQARLRLKEYTRRKNAGELEPSEFAPVGRGERRPGKPQETCKYGHPLTPRADATRTSGQRRYCKTCQAEYRKSPEGRARRSEAEKRRLQQLKETDPEAYECKREAERLRGKRDRERPEVQARISQYVRKRAQTPEYRAWHREYERARRQKKRERTAAAIGLFDKCPDGAETPPGLAEPD